MEWRNSVVKLRRSARLVGAVVCVGVSWLSVAVLGGIKIDPGNMSPYSKTKVSANLYAKPDPAASGGIKGVIADAPSEVLGILVIPQKFPDVSALSNIEGGLSGKNARNINKDIKNEVYLAGLGGDNSFVLYGLPPGKYDLFVLCENCFYEGLLLSRAEHTLKDSDIKSIKDKINESNPFFNLKHQHRIEGQTGTYGRARVVEQEVRTLPVTLQDARVLTHIQIRSIKLCFMESVGTARLGTHWELKKTREITRQELGPPETKGLIPGYFRKSLQGFRVSSRLRDVGVISLAAASAEGADSAAGDE